MGGTVSGSGASDSGMKTYRIALPILVACLALSACAGQDGGGTQETGSTPGQSGAPMTTPSDGPSAPVPPTGAPGESARPPAPPSAGQPTEWPPGGPGKSPAPGGASLTGTITSGVEPGCLLLGGYLLVGGPRDQLRAGGKVTVTGKVQPDLMTTCQQGTPFLVETVKPA